MDKSLILAKSVADLKKQVAEALAILASIEQQQGPQGPKGDKGDKGDAGKDGKDGLNGKDGRDGIDGKDGKDGSDGISVVDARIDIDNSLVITLSDGREIDCGQINPEQANTIIGMARQGFGNNFDYIDFNTTTSATSIPGRLSWNDRDGTLDLGLKGGNVTLQIGQENILLVKNDDTVTLTDGMVVYVSGASGENLLVKRALATSDLTSATTIGIVTETIAVNAAGFVTTFGTVRGLNTSSFNEGDVLYLSPTTAGAITNVKPIAPEHLVSVGYVQKKSSGNGEIFVKVDNGYEIDELHNVKITNPQDGQYLKYNATLGVWVNSF